MQCKAQKKYLNLLQRTRARNAYAKGFSRVILLSVARNIVNVWSARRDDDDDDDVKDYIICTEIMQKRARVWGRKGDGEA